ncbi:MAG: polysaccharide deacetylase family protein [Saprospiraceae bacterium]
MITIYVPPNFVPERSYAINTLLNHYLGLEINIVPRSGQVHYEMKWEDKSILIKDHFFGHTIVGETYLAPNRIPEKVFSAQSAGLDQVACIFGNDHVTMHANSIQCELDLFAGAFFMLTRWEESFGTYEDLHGRFPADKSVIVKHGFILRPVVDEYVALLKRWLTIMGYPVPQQNSSFKVVPTCDVDIPFYWRSRPAWRLLLGRFLQHKRFDQLKKDRLLLNIMRGGSERDPFDTFDYLMSMAEKHGLRFLFHMIGGGETKFEGYYRIDDPHILELMQSFKKRGHGIGLHPSYNAFNDLRKIEEERKKVAAHSGSSVYASRQHYLRFAVPDTWGKLSTAFIREDSTLGYAAEPGFRCGTSRPFPVFDVHQKKQLPLIERPLLIMDVSLRFYKGFSIAESIAYCKIIIDQVKKHEGELVFLWHNSTLSDQDGWTGWDQVPEFLMAT